MMPEDPALALSLVVQAQTIQAAGKAVALWAAGDLDSAKALADLLSTDDYVQSIATSWWANTAVLIGDQIEYEFVTERADILAKVLELGRLIQVLARSTAGVVDGSALAELWASFGDDKHDVSGLALDLAGQLTAATQNGGPT